jgi:hypothetical protein
VALTFHQVRRALEPPWGLRDLWRRWNHWAAALRETAPQTATTSRKLR